MKCASCSAPLNIKAETTEFNCLYCGAAQIVDRSGGTVTLTLIEETLGRVQQGTDRTASELALVRLKKLKRDIPYPYICPKPYPPTAPEMPRPILKSGWSRFWEEVWASRDLSSQNNWRHLERVEIHARLFWEAYDKYLDNYNQELCNYQAMLPQHNNLLKIYFKKISEVDAEIAIHESIVKRR